MLTFSHCNRHMGIEGTDLHFPSNTHWNIVHSGKKYTLFKLSFFKTKYSWICQVKAILLTQTLFNLIYTTLSSNLGTDPRYLCSPHECTDYFFLNLLGPLYHSLEFTKCFFEIILPSGFHGIILLPGYCWQLFHLFFTVLILPINLPKAQALLSLYTRKVGQVCIKGC